MEWDIRIQNRLLSYSGGLGRRSNRRRNLSSALDSSSGGGGSRSSSRLNCWLRCVRLVVRAIPRDVTGLGALVADLAGRAQWTAVGGSAVTRDVTLSIASIEVHAYRIGSTHKLSAGIALHGLSLTIPSEVVGASTLVAGGSPGVSSISTTETSVEAPTRSTNATASSLDGRSWAVTLERNASAFVQADEG